MEKRKNMRINKLSTPVPEYRLEEIQEMLAFHDMPTVLSTMLKYIPEENFRHVIEDLKNEQGVILENMINEREGNGQGALKILVGKSLDGKLTDAECDKIGAIIASMDGVPKGYYVGMVNFLGASCRIYHRIQGSYAEAALIRAKSKSPEHPKGIPPEPVPDVVNRMFPGKTMPTEAELKQRAAQEAEDVKQRMDDESADQKFKAKAEEVEYYAAAQAGQYEQQPQKQKEQPETPETEDQAKLRAKEAEVDAALKAQQDEAELKAQQEEKRRLNIEKQKKNREEMIAKRKQQSQKQSAFKQYVPQLQMSKGMGQFGKMGRK